MHALRTIRLASCLAVAAILMAIGTTGGSEPGPIAAGDLTTGQATEHLVVGSPRAAEAICSLVALASEVPSEATPWLLPPGTTVDAVRWVENVIEIELTVAAHPSWYLTATDLETLTAVFASPFLADDAFGGSRVWARTGLDQPYGALEQFALEARAGVPAAPEPEAIDVWTGAPTDFGGPRAPLGPTMQAGRQPAGALTGVTVFVSGGHGWTAGTSSWALQRPVGQEMVEDYGNIDMLNYFVHFAFNAGATVVPLRPVGWQPIEIVLDNDDPGVTYTGSWSDGSSSKYYENGVTNSGIVYRWASASTTETATARFSPTISTTGFYPVYGFTIAGTNRVRQTYRVKYSGGITEVGVDHRNVGNGWIWLGDYYLQAGDDVYVEITNQSAETGVVVADAIRWGDGMGDISRPGPNSVSGYPRDEECMRYWAHSELGNHAVGFDTTIWDVVGSDDTSDNVGTGARWAREMNQVPAGGDQVDRWKRVHVEFHTNAFDGTARGQVCLINSTYPTTYQTQFATTLSNEIDADMLIADDEFEFAWVDRSSPTLSGSYGAISTQNNGNEFDATLVELAFHDNSSDAALLRDDRVRAAAARAATHGIIRFLRTLPGSQVPLAFPPDTPRDFRVQDLGGGNIMLAWVAPLSDGARGDPATGYVVYQSGNGYGFGNPIVLGNVLTTTVTGVPPGETRYFRVAATNAGGESMPSETLALRRPASGTAEVLVVSGFDRLRRQLNPIQTFTQPPAYAGQHIERQIWRQSNAYDYVIQHAQALAASNVGFASCTNEAVADGGVALGDYGVVVWMLGMESSEDLTFTTTEQAKVTTYLNSGGALFVTGADLAYDLINQNHGASFAQTTLHVGYAANSADTYQASGAPAGILSDIGTFAFNLAGGAPYNVASADVLAVASGAVACLNYVGGTGGVAGVQYNSGTYKAVTLAVPFEAIGPAAVRTQIMQRVLNYLMAPPLPFDYDHDDDVDMVDFGAFVYCLAGPEFGYVPGHFCLIMDGDGDFDVDTADFALMQAAFTGP